MIAGPSSNPPKVGKRLRLELTVFDPDTVLKVGEVWTMHVHVDRAAIALDKVLAKRPTDSGDWEDTDEEGILPGGGIALLRSQREAHKLAAELSGDEKIGGETLARL